AEIFAAALASELDIPVDMQIIIRTQKRREQARLADHEREVNIRGVFEAIADAEPGETVILVDDVVTGGHTVSEAKRVLEAAGFFVPAAISLAHGL
ncbi:MAG: phosphoribosyltransferase family protein, partial [Candidatus Zixiibacteriota bacterium]